MADQQRFAICPSCAEQIRTEAIRCKHCGRVPVEGDKLNELRAYARMSPDERGEWMRGLGPAQGREFWQLWKRFGREVERTASPDDAAPKPAPRTPRRKSVSPSRLGVALLVVVSLLLLLSLLPFVPWEVSGALQGVALMVGLVAVGLAVYFLPAIIASQRGHHQAGSILVINLFLGWTFLGWVVAFAMACSAVKTLETPSPEHPGQGIP